VVSGGVAVVTGGTLDVASGTGVVDPGGGAVVVLMTGEGVVVTPVVGAVVVMGGTIGVWLVGAAADARLQPAIKPVNNKVAASNEITSLLFNLDTPFYKI